MKLLKNLPLKTQNVVLLRNDDKLSVDKTTMIYQLIFIDNYYVLSHTHWFVKSLLLPSIHSYFKSIIDMMLQATNYCYMMVLKMKRTAEKALQQITSKNYEFPIETANRKLIKIGFNLNNDTRNIEK